MATIDIEVKGVRDVAQIQREIDKFTKNIEAVAPFVKVTTSIEDVPKSDGKDCKCEAGYQLTNRYTGGSAGFRRQTFDISCDKITTQYIRDHSGGLGSIVEIDIADTKDICE